MRMAAAWALTSGNLTCHHRGIVLQAFEDLRLPLPWRAELPPSSAMREASLPYIELHLPFHLEPVELQEQFLALRLHFDGQFDVLVFFLGVGVDELQDRGLLWLLLLGLLLLSV